MIIVTIKPYTFIHLTTDRLYAKHPNLQIALVWSSDTMLALNRIAYNKHHCKCLG